MRHRHFRRILGGALSACGLMMNAGLATAQPAAQTAPQGPPLNLPSLYAPPLPEWGDAPTRTFAEGSVMYGGITYSEVVGYRPMKLDLYLPANAPGPEGLPLVVWFHGGGYEIGNPQADWTQGDWTHVLGRLAARGFAVAAVTYRLKREAPFPAQLEDGRAAIRFVGANAKRWHIDTSRTYSWGLSAGAHIAAMIAVTGDGTQGPKIAGAAEWFGPMDLVLRSADPGKSAAYSRLLACDGLCSADVLTKASPITHVNAATPPFFVAQGVDDNLVPPIQADVMVKALKDAGVPVTYERLDGMGHGFEGGSKEAQEQILLDTFAFFETLAAR